MAQAPEAKIPNNIRFTSRQLSALRVEAGRVGITISDQVRRIIDEWVDSRPTKPGLQRMYQQER